MIIPSGTKVRGKTLRFKDNTGTVIGHMQLHGELAYYYVLFDEPRMDQEVYPDEIEIKS